jgi:hypothetical protein
LAQTLTISNTGGGTLSWTASESASWLSLSRTSGAITAGQSSVITVSVNTAGLGAGTYSSTIAISAPGSTNPSQQIPVTLTVTVPPPVIGNSPTSLSFTMLQGSTSLGSQTLSITNPGKGTLSWTASEAVSWLTLSPVSGTTTTETDVISVTVNPTGLASNLYTTPISITASGATNSPQQVLVTVAITAPTSGVATLSWDANTEGDLAGYKVYAGTASRSYGPPIDVGNVTSFQIINLQPGQTYYFAVTAYDTVHNQSGYSNEASKRIP